MPSLTGARCCKSPNNKRISLHLFAEVYIIPYMPLQAHITSNDSKRIKLGSGVGKKPVIGHSTTEITVDVHVRKDRANQGARVGETPTSWSVCATRAPARSSTMHVGAPCGLDSKAA